MRLNVRMKLLVTSSIPLAAASVIAAIAIGSLSSASSQAALAILAVLAAGIVIGLAAALAVSRSIRTGIESVQTTLTSMADVCAASLEEGLGALSRNDLSVGIEASTRPIERHDSDEIGRTAEVANRLLARIQAAVHSYEQARAGLAGTVEQVKAAAEAMASSADQLTAVATQSGQASAQVAMTIGQVASGANDQARAASQTSAASLELTGIIERSGRVRRAPGSASRTRRGPSTRPRRRSTRRCTTREEMAPLNERVDEAAGGGGAGRRRDRPAA